MEWIGRELGEKMLINPRNPISLAMTLDQLSSEKVTLLGSKLFTRCVHFKTMEFHFDHHVFRNVSGTRVVKKDKIQSVSGIEFGSYGGHYSEYPHHYLTMAAAIGITKTDIDHFIQKLRTVYCEIQYQSSPTNTNTN